MAVYICDAIMGSGKTESSITYMNSHPDQKFIYAAPYIDEAKRIVDSCPALNFVEPESKYRSHFSKIQHTRDLLSRGENIASTHQAFKLYTKDMIEDIKRWGYTLIIDEALEMLNQCNVANDDFDLMMKAGVLSVDNNGHYQTDYDYSSGALTGFFNDINRDNLVRVESKGGVTRETFLYWELRPDVFKAFKDVYVLTYLMRGQEMLCFLKANDISYEIIGTGKEADGTFHFAPPNTYVPEYTKHITTMVNILDNKKMNSIGDKPTAMSAGWFQHASNERKDTLRKNLQNYYTHYCKNDTPYAMWTTFKAQVMKLRGRGYTTKFVPCTIRGSNAYRDRTWLAYIVNIYENPFKKQYLVSQCPEFSEEMFALSSMIQWIWRSAIRDGKPINVYIPSRRMRTLLILWMLEVEKGNLNLMKK